MCFEPSARPPLPPIAGGAGTAGSEELVLEASDGNRFNAFSARAVRPGAPAVMILPDVRGLHPFYQELAVASPRPACTPPRWTTSGAAPA
jgi:carboxymethylenebutenolidase